MSIDDKVDQWAKDAREAAEHVRELQRQLLTAKRGRYLAESRYKRARLYKQLDEARALVRHLEAEIAKITVIA